MRLVCLIFGLVALSFMATAGDAPKSGANPKITPKSNAGEKLSTFPDGKFGRGELVHDQGLAILTLRGTPTEMGEQFGHLAILGSPGLEELHKNFVHDSGIGRTEPFVRLLAMRLKTGTPSHHLTELEAAVKSSQRPIELGMFANCVYDLSTTMGCSTVIVNPAQSKTSAPLFGRNFDWLPARGMREHTLLVVGQPTGKRAFAISTVPPILGCISGMNDAGLSCTINEIHLPQAKDKPAFQWDGVPMLFAIRQVLEECATVAEAEKLLNSMKRTTTACLSICDKSSGAIFEITPKSIVVRKAVKDVVWCTNDFRSEELGKPKTCWRYDKLTGLNSTADKVGVSEVFAQLDAVNQGKFTLQSMVFEPAARKLHLKVGAEPATKLDAKVIDLGKYFDAKWD
jgi:isopenicillin-N N-acyltransferase like protein